MISSKTITILRNASKRPVWKCCNFASSTQQTDRDPAPLFFDKEVQSALKTLTRPDYKKVLRIRKAGKPLKNAEYKFMTDEELAQAFEASHKIAESRLHMPPIVKVCPEDVKVLSKDYGIHAYSSAKYVFTDISFGGNNRNRMIAIREPDGILRTATMNERHRMNQIYFPIPGRELSVPKMFTGDYFENLLDKREYEFVLDRACAQFEPNDPNYQDITKKVYNHINRNNHFDYLRSTRHFGPMVFHLLWSHDIDNLLIELIETKHIKEAELLVRMFDKFNPSTGISAEKYEEDKEAVQLIKRYAEMESVRRNRIERALAVYEEFEREKQKVEEGIRKAHGINIPATEPDT